MARAVVPVRLDPGVIRELDEARGDLTRSRWIGLVVERQLRPDYEPTAASKSERMAATAQAISRRTYRCRCPKEWPGQTMCSDCGWVAR